MDDQLLFEQFHAAYESEPRAGSFERFHATLVRAEVQRRRLTKFGFRLSYRSLKLVAAVAIAVLAIASAGGFIAINQYVHRAVPITGPHARTGTIPGTVVGSAAYWPFSADDAAAVLYDPSTVFFTHDGGATWRPLEMPACPLEMPYCYQDSPQINVRWIDSDNIVVMYGDHLIEVTSDGGIHWQLIRSGHEILGGQAFFLNAHEGWQYWSVGLLHTTDGGAHWAEVSTSFTNFSYQLVFIDSEDGFIKHDGIQPSITHDGGHKWSPGVVSPPPPVSQFGIPSPQGPFLFGKSGVIAFANADGSTLSVYKTSDGGLTWTEPRSAPGITLAALDVSEWWVLDGNGRLSRTSDGGSSWQRIQTDLASRYFGMTLTSVTPVSRSVLWGSAADAIVRSTDGGGHWSLVRLPG